MVTLIVLQRNGYSVTRPTVEASCAICENVLVKFKSHHSLYFLFLVIFLQNDSDLTQVLFYLETSHQFIFWRKGIVFRSLILCITASLSFLQIAQCHPMHLIHFNSISYQNFIFSSRKTSISPDIEVQDKMFWDNKF